MLARLGPPRRPGYFFEALLGCPTREPKATIMDQTLPEASSKAIATDPQRPSVSPSWPCNGPELVSNYFARGPLASTSHSQDTPPNFASWLPEAPKKPWEAKPLPTSGRQLVSTWAPQSCHCCCDSASYSLHLAPSWPGLGSVLVASRALLAPREPHVGPHWGPPVTQYGPILAHLLP